MPRDKDFLKIFLFVIFVLVLQGCAVKSDGTRTWNFGGENGVQVTSETVEGSSQDLVEVEKEKTRQKCLEEKSKADIKMYETASADPRAIADIKNSELITNLVSLAITRKPYDPCPSSTNSADVEIADAAMYTSIYKDAFALIGKGLTGYFIWQGTTSVIESIAGMTSSSGQSLTLTGNDNTVQTSVFNPYTVGGTGQWSIDPGGIFSGGSTGATTTTTN